MTHERRRGPHTDTGIPPASMVLRDLDLMRGRDTLRTTREVEELILLQSMEGRAHEGHGGFESHRFFNTTEDDLARALKLDTNAVRRHRQSLITDIVEWAHRAARGDETSMLMTPEFRPLLGIGLFDFLEVNAGDVLRGLYLGGLRDTVEIRAAAEQRYGVNIGAGKLYRVDFAVMQRMGLNGAQLANQDHGSRIEEYKKVGLITEALPAPDSTVRYMYIRDHVGPGASDDAAIVAAGLRYGRDTALGVFLADAIDTLEKYVPAGQEGDQDALLAEKVRKEWVGLVVGPDQAAELAFLAVGGPGLPDSSLRHLLRINRHYDQSPIEAHLLKTAGKPYAPLELGHERTPNDEFYEVVEGRVDRIKQAPDPGARTHH